MKHNNSIEDQLQGLFAKHSGQGSALIDSSDLLRQLVAVVLQNCLNDEFKKFLGADSYERTENRRGLRNGFYERNLTTRVGNVVLAVARDRNGQFKTEVYERYQRNEKALVLTLAEMVVKGVSTRKVTGITEQLIGVSYSKSSISRMVCELDEHLKEWRERLLSNTYTYLVVDARYEKVREGGRIVSKAAVIVVGISSTGEREILGTYVINSESYEGWNSVFDDLKSRGLQGVKYAVADDNKGLRKALNKHFQDILIQRCQVHYMRNFMSKLNSSIKEEGIRLLREVFDAATREGAQTRSENLTAWLRSNKKDGIADWIDESLDDTLQVLELPMKHRKKMKSTNMLERVNQELKRRSRVIRIFPNEASCLRMMTALCVEISEGWSGKRYLEMEE